MYIGCFRPFLYWQWPEDFLTLKVLPPKTEVGQALRKVPAIKKEMVGEQQQREREREGNSKHTSIVLRYLHSISTILPTYLDVFMTG